MPGLFGIFSKTQDLTAELLSTMARRMAESMQPVSWLRMEIWGDATFCGGRVHLGVTDEAPEPLLTKDKVIRVWVDGELHIQAEAGAGSPSAETLIELVESARGSLSEVDGVFAMACYDATKRELVLANDRLGYRQIYYTETEDWFAYAGEVKALLTIRDRLPELDEISLREFFGYDHMLGQRTWWKGIELIPPANIWRVSPLGRAAKRYWTFDEIRRDRQDFDIVREECDRLWSTEVRRYSKPGTTPLLLSGGMDSRLLLAELHSQGADLIAVTFGHEKSIDMRFAKLCAAAAGVPHRTCYLTTKNWWHNREQAILQTDGSINAMNFQVSIARDEMRVGNCYSPMNIIGDVLFGGSHLIPGLGPDWQLSPEKLLGPRYLENPFFTRDEVVSASLADARPYMNGPSSDCFHLLQRMRRLTLHGPGSLRSHCTIVYPGLCYPLLKLMLGSLSDDERIGHKFYNSWLLRRHPKFYANIPWQATGRGLDESALTRITRSSGMRFKNLARRFKKAHQGNAADRWFVDYQDCVRESKIRERLLVQDLAIDNYLRGAAKRALANSELAPMRPRVILAILTIETYLRQVSGLTTVLDSVSRDY
jgi:asparagine synthase (glutamine-hydrolysing)